jgi:2-polyprenyl-3-methyl-5-hydroxy-6-metoxy-1,4-benzoquinol methylase
MSLRLGTFASFQLPVSYDDVRLHHAVGLYIGYQALVSSGLYQFVAKNLLSLTSKLTEYFIPMIQYGIVPDFLIRYGIRVQLSNHLQQLRHPVRSNVIATSTSTSSRNDTSENIPIVEALLQTKMDMVQTLSTMPIAIDTDKANKQHYEVPAAFYNYCLGPCKKYSSGYWPAAVNKKSSCSFPESEVYMLELYCQRAGIADSDPAIPLHIVDLGCGWGSLSLYVASKYPHTVITGISNSHSQREYIMSQAKERKLNNVTILTVRTAWQSLQIE